jgi:spore maturation protein CgeB
MGTKQMSSRTKRVLHLGSYLYGSSDIVYRMQLSLGRIPSVKSNTRDMQLYRRFFAGPHVREDGAVNWVSDAWLRQEIEHHRPDILICNAGRLSPTAEMHSYLKNLGVFRVGIALSDPDDFSATTRHFARYFDLFYTNTTQSILDYKSIGVTASVLPFAADSDFHRPLNFERHHFDLVVVGEGRPERFEVVRKLREMGVRVKTHGKNWRRWWIESLGFSTQVFGERQIRALNSAPLYISFGKTIAGFTNVKVGLFEAASCGLCVFTERSNEVLSYFEDGDEIITFDSEDELVRKIVEYSQQPERARQVGLRARERVLKEHTWTHRWKKVLEDVSNRSRS